MKAFPFLFPLAVVSIALALTLVGCSSTEETPAQDPPPASWCAVPSGADGSIRPVRPRDGLVCQRVATPLGAPRDVIQSPDGMIFLSEMSAGKISRFDGRFFSTVASGLSAPIGLREAIGGDLLVVEENSHVLARIDRTSGTRSVVATFDTFLTYLALGPDGAAYVSSFRTLDQPDGVVHRVDLATGTSTPFADGITVPEGLAFDADGRLLVAEWGTKPSRVTRFPDRTVVASGFKGLYGLVRAPHNDGWIVSDVKGDRVVLVKDDGTEEDILTGVAAPAGLWVTEARHLLVAEHGNADSHAATGYLLRVSGF